jgi:Neuraminidase (sialidase)
VQRHICNAVFVSLCRLLSFSIYKEQLELLGYKVISYYISSTQTNSPMYYLFFATTNDKVYSLQKQIKPQIETLKGTEWVKKNFQIQDIVNNLADGRQKGLFDPY